MKRIIIVRHGATESNISGQMRGWSDDPLSALGRKQAARTAEYAKSFEPVDKIYVSTLARSIQTGQPIAAALNVEMQQLADLREINLGTLEGGTEQQLWGYFLKQALLHGGKSRKVVFPEGESVGTFLSRIDNAVAQIMQNHSEESVLIVAHGVAAMVMLGRWLEPNLLTWPKFRLENCSVTEVEFTPKPKLVRLNDVSHLKGITTDDGTMGSASPPGIMRPKK